MALTPISQIRRRELMLAAFQVLQREGIHGATLERVAAEAGCSKGIVLHYFRDKQELFEQTMRFTNALLRDEVIRRLKLCRSASERLWAIAEGNFSPEFFRPSICHAWLALCAEVPRNSQFARIQRVIHARMNSNLRSALTQLVAPSELETISFAITSLIDGLWLRAGLQSGGITGELALAQIADYLRHRIPNWDLPR